MVRLGSAGEESQNPKEEFTMSAYTWKTASYIKANADDAGKMCEELSRTVGLTAETLLEASEREDAPLHNEFEWDDTKAAHEYRLGQSRHIIACLMVVPEEQPETAEPVRAFLNVVKEESKYHSINAILRSEDLHKAMLNRAKAELQAFERKYSELKELKTLFDLIDTM
jgi:hypothetical protein